MNISTHACDSRCVLLKKGVSWQDVSVVFPNVIGQKVTDIQLTTHTNGFYDSVFMGDGNRPDGGDYFDSLLIVLENGFVLELYGQEEYMWVNQISDWSPVQHVLDVFGQP